MSDSPHVKVRPVEVLMPDGSVAHGEFHVWLPTSSRVSRLDLRIGTRHLSKSASTHWDALRQIRFELEQEGMLLRCYGASRNVSPSGMSLDMCGGVRAYRLYPDRASSREDSCPSGRPGRTATRRPWTSRRRSFENGGASAGSRRMRSLFL
jgi:hypothetical protein